MGRRHLQSQGRPAPRNRLLRFGSAGTALIVSAALAGTAGAQLNLDDRMDVGPSTGVDTDYTPVAKNTEHWKLIAGARFSSTEVQPGSATRFDADLYDVAFRNEKLGLAGGSRCRETTEPDETETCERVPAMHAYRVEVNGDRGWNEVELPGSDRRGYVGAITWLSPTRALAVGGDGRYPRREPACVTGSAGCPDPAGAGRAWLLDDGRWSELDLSGPVTAGIRGMTALDVHPRTPELALAGGLAELWQWHEGEFVRRIDRSLPPTELHNRQLFGFRVREIRYRPVNSSASSSASKQQFDFAVAGCCAETEAMNTPRIGSCTREPPEVPLNCTIGRMGGDATDDADPERRRGNVNDTNWSVNERRPANDTCNYWQATSRWMADGEICVDRPGRFVESPLAMTLPDAEVTGSLRNGSSWRFGGSVCLGERRVSVFGNQQEIHPPVCDLPPAPSGSGTASGGGSWSTQWNEGDAHCSGPYSTGDMPDLLTGTPAEGAVPEKVPDEPTCVDLPQASGDVPGSPVPDSGPQVGDDLDEPLYTPRRVNGRSDVPDSFFSLMNDWTGIRSVLASPGGGPKDGEPASMFHGTGGDPVRSLTTGRLASADGDSARKQASVQIPFFGGQPGPDGLADWAVGEMRATAIPKLGSQGLIVATHMPKPPPPSVNADTGSGSVKPENTSQPTRFLEANYWRSPSYRLNAVEMIEGTGIGWAVGDHGAILAVNEADFAKLAPEPEAPKLGSRRPRPLPDSSPYDSAKPQAAVGEPGTVGVFDRQPLETRDEARGRPFPDIGHDVGRFLISASGDQGWAWGGGQLSYFDGSRWVSCAPPDDPALPEPHSACDGAPWEVYAAARVPLENDSDPTNDDDFEIVAFTDRKEIMRYRDGAWRTDPPESFSALSNVAGDVAKSSVAFTSPDDGLLLVPPTATRVHLLYDWDGEKWTNCKPSCDPDGRLPPGLEIPLAGSTDRGSLKGLVAAGDRIYAYGYRRINAPVYVLVNSWTGIVTPDFPFIAYRERGEKTFSAEPRAGELDPAFGAADPSDVAGQQGHPDGLAVARRPDGTYEGWATGRFGAATRVENGATPPETPLMHLDPGGAWRKWAKAGPIKDYYHGFQSSGLSLGAGPTAGPRQIVVFPGAGRMSRALIALGERLYRLDTRSGAWRLARLNRPLARGSGPGLSDGAGPAIADDGHGGAWISRRLRYSHLQRKPLFRDVPWPDPQPGRKIRDLAAAPDGTVWAATNSDVLYRYDRVTGWDRIRIPGWDPGRVVIVPTPVNSIAVSPSGEGVAVGPGGRIARISRDSLALDAAAAKICQPAAPAPPCGTTRDLQAVAVAPDGSALAGGDGLATLWRPPGGEFRAVERPPAAAAAKITALAMPSSRRAWLATNSGLVYAGEMNQVGSWSWRLENIDSEGDAIKVGAITDLVVHPAGRGYAIGEGSNGAGVLERRSDSTGQPWRRVALEPATAVALPAGGGTGALLAAGPSGHIHTLIDDRWEVAHPGELLPHYRGSITSLALVPGIEPGQVEVWASNGEVLLHHSNAPAEPLLNPDGRSEPLPDVPPQQSDEISFATFGRSECAAPVGWPCPEMSGSTELSEVLAERIMDEVVERNRAAGGRMFTLFTGDAVDYGGYPGNEALESQAGGGANAMHDVIVPFLGVDNSIAARGPGKLRRWREMVPDSLEERGVPTLAAVGSKDLADLQPCSGRCVSTRTATSAGENVAWRQAMAPAPAPWGREAARRSGPLQLKPVRDGSLTVNHRNQELPDPDGDGPLPKPKPIPSGGARTHYAIDVVDTASDRKLARVVVLDNSFRSLAGSDSIQNPSEGEGGQATWLRRMLCTRGGSVAGACTRKPDQKAIVLANTPTYSPGPGSTSDTAADGAALEAIAMSEGTDVVVSGRIGWNGVYWATAPGLHEPCPGAPQQEHPPEPGANVCGSGQIPVGSAPQPMDAVAQAIRTAQDTSATAMVGDAGSALTSLLPFVVASGAGGRLAGFEGREGFWNGYTIVRLDPLGDPRRTIVERRPVYDWVSLSVSARVLRAGQRLKLHGVGRGPLAGEIAAIPVRAAPVKFDRLDTASITHRYDLVEADPARPWLPKLDGSGQYVPLDPSVATVDRTTGLVRVGKGNQPRTYGIGVLSAGRHVASVPLVFEPRRTFEPRTAPSPQQLPRVIVQSAAAGITPPASPGAPPHVGSVSPPVLPSFPPVQPPPATPPVGLPQPAPPPAPPAASPPTALQLTPTPVGLTIAPPASVVPPPAPPINPAPPGGARREARQRQAATEKSGSGSGEEKSDIQDAGGDMAQQGPDRMTRLDRVRAEPGSFTAVARPDQPSAWARGALYGGGLTIAALAMTGLWTARPRPRPRPPAVPAPARAWNRRR